MEGLKVSDADLVVYIHPSKANKVSQSILRELSSLLFKFDETFDGVVLAYDVNARSEKAKILPGIHPLFGVKLSAKLLLFHPKPDMLLEGHVVKLSQQAIHVIVLGFSSAIITEEDIREEFKFKVKRDQEGFTSKSHKRHKIKVGTILRFLVKSFDEDILHMSGSLLPAHTGSVRWLDKNTEVWSNVDRFYSQLESFSTWKSSLISESRFKRREQWPFCSIKQLFRISKKRKEGEGRGEVQCHDRTMADAVTVSVNADHRHKKPKRQRSAEDS